MKFSLPGKLLFCLSFVWLGMLFGTGLARAAEYKIEYVRDLEGIKQAQADVCEDRDNCIGWHYCSVSAKLANGSTRAYNWVAYNAFFDAPIFDYALDGGALSQLSYLRVLFNCNDQACGFSARTKQWNLGTTVIPERDLYSGSCQYEDPFCCCTLKNGRADDCQRAVDYGKGPNPVAQCNFQTADVYKPFTAKAYPQYASVINRGSGCQALQDVLNRAQDAKERGQQQVVQSSIDIKKEATILNQSRFTSAEQVIGQLVKILVSFIGSIALALYIGAGVIWMTSMGNSERIDRAKRIFVWTTLGVMVMLASYFIVQFLFTTLNI